MKFLVRNSRGVANPNSKEELAIVCSIHNPALLLFLNRWWILIQCKVVFRGVFIQTLGFNGRIYY